MTSKIRTCEIEGCHEKHYAKGHCKKHYDKLDRQGYWKKRYEENRDRLIKQCAAWRQTEAGKAMARRRSSMRRAKAKEAEGEEFNWTPDTHCHYCYKEVSIDLPPQHPDRATMEHIYPLSKKRLDPMWHQFCTHFEDNITTSCWECNRQKDNKHPLQFQQEKDWEFILDTLEKQS